MDARVDDEAFPQSAEGEPTGGGPGGRAPLLTESLDLLFRSAMAHNTNGVSQLSLATALFDWSTHLALAPGRQINLANDAFALAARAARKAAAPSKARGAAGDQAAGRTGTAGLRAMRAAFEELDEWIDKAAEAPPGVARRHRELVRFAARQWLDPLRPENFLLTNEDAIARTFDERGSNLYRGWLNWLDDAARLAGIATGARDGPEVGRDLAATPGEVVYRNDLIELIQYTPTTEKVHAEPLLIVPAWIMKYYILDLSPHNSMVRHLVDQGFTVFMISWRNPGPGDADLSFDDYRRLGVLAALEAIEALTPGRRAHAVGYCLGGTLLAIAAAALAREKKDRLASLTLLAAQTDFRDAGELAIFIDEDQLEWLESAMRTRGVLGGDQMGQAFQALRSRELIWRRMQRAYLFGEKDQVFDLMVWNADATRMPYRMHSEYLRRLFLGNDFVQGRFEVDGKPVAVSDIRAPIFALGTEKDHIAPWRSVFKIHLFADCEVTFALVNGGHNAGVVSEPGRPRRRHRILTKADYDHYIAPDDWLATAEAREGSWWPSWFEWLVARSSGLEAARAPTRADVAGNKLAAGNAPPAAPGAYVLQR